MKKIADAAEELSERDNPWIAAKANMSKANVKHSGRSQEFGMQGARRAGTGVYIDVHEDSESVASAQANVSGTNVKRSGRSQHQATQQTARTASFETLRWRDDVIEMIDQRILPAAFEYVPCNSAKSVAQAIRDMVVRGAPAIGVAAAYGVALEAMCVQSQAQAVFEAAMERGFELLAASRPTAVNLFWALERMRRVWQSCDGMDNGEIAQRLLAEAHDMLDEDIRINRAMGACGAALLPDGARVLTHCNAGALATAGHGTALGVFRSAIEAGKKIAVFADETRPFLQGARLTAWEMVQEGIDVTLICDNMAGHLMAKGEIDAVVVGTDRVAANGDVANKIGTYMVAVLAQRHGIPFYVACPLSTIDLSVATGADIPIEERDENEVKGFRDYVWAPQGVKIRNPAFDVTPAELVTALITEKGVIGNDVLIGGDLSAWLRDRT